ncbi:MAG: DUF1572 family protein [Cyclobacteriaceae bacterium]|nr:DUF1572 family protein [Cyclobacteriaceae bacterium]
MLYAINILFQRDLDKLRSEISEYNNEKLLWVIKGDIKNSSGHLTLHICGNLQHYIGKILGNTDYKRNREFEFNATDISLSYLYTEIESTKNTLNNVLPNLDINILKKNYPIEVLGYPMTTEFFILHLSAHLSYHLGQINYHKRLITSLQP